VNHDTPPMKHLATIALGFMFLFFVGPAISMALAMFGFRHYLIAWPVSTIVLTGLVYLQVACESQLTKAATSNE
jgi:hypothetical protein